MAATQKPEPMKDGVYFGIPEADYHEIARLSSSGIQRMMVSPATFWAQSWLNPNKPEATDKSYQIIGRAYHVARLEPDRYALDYVRELSKDDMDPGALLTDADIKSALKDMGEAQTKPGEGVLERAFRLRMHGYVGQIYHIEQHQWEAERGDRIPLPGAVMDEIEISAGQMRQVPELAELITGGASEVTVLWTDEFSGVPMKARLDYVKPDRFVDIKTFDNSRGRHVDHAIYSAFQYNRIYIQAALYHEAMEVIRDGLPIAGNATSAQIQMVQAIRDGAKPSQAWYIFQEKGGTPNIFGRRIQLYAPNKSVEAQSPEGERERLKDRYQSATGLHIKARTEINWARGMFNTMREAYADGKPWLPLNPIGVIDDDCFSLNWIQGDW